MSQVVHQYLLSVGKHGAACSLWSMNLNEINEALRLFCILITQPYKKYIY